MDTLPSLAGDLNDLEQRLSEWRPSAAGLDANSMLFAAGRASVRPGWGRITWPIVSGCLAIAAVALSVALVQERAARLELAAQLSTRPVVVPAPSSLLEPIPVTTVEPPALHSYLAGRRALAQDFDVWLVPVHADAAPGSAPPSRPIWRATSRFDVVDQ
jgi:hypothetical protein